MSSHKCRSLDLSFIDRHGLWSDAQGHAAATVDTTIRQKNLELVRFSFPDQHGVLRGKTLVAAEASHDDYHFARQGHVASQRVSSI